MSEKIKNIIIVDHEPYSFRKNGHYYINDFLSDGWNIEYWGVNNMVNYMKDVHYGYREEAIFVKYFDNTADLLNSIQNYSSHDTLFILELLFNKDTHSIFQTIKENKFKWVRIHYYINTISIGNKTKSTLEKFLALNLDSFISLVKRKFFLRNIKKEDLHVPDILFLTGSNKNLAYEAKKIVSIDYFDVETYNKLQVSPRPLEYKYIVFLDIMLATHPDFQRVVHKKSIDKQKYFERLDRFFSIIEEQTNLPIVIASHPKADYTNEFGSRLCLKHKTAELSVHSEIVLTHGSLSISFALLAKKSLIYMYSKELFSSKKYKDIMDRIDVACDKLGSVKINIDDYNGKDLLPIAIEEDKYDAFLASGYLKSKKDDNRSNFTIINDNFIDLIK